MDIHRSQRGKKKRAESRPAHPEELRGVLTAARLPYAALEGFVVSTVTRTARRPGAKAFSRHCGEKMSEAVALHERGEAGDRRRHEERRRPASHRAAF